MQTAPAPLAVVKAKDSILFTEDGKQYLDCNSSWWVNIHGHGNEYLKNAISEQFDKIDHVIFAGVTHPKAVELSKRILNFLPNNLSKVFFSDDGSTNRSTEYWLWMALITAILSAQCRLVSETISINLLNIYFLT
jgi:adenosylmethionine-8-amino-7-oxononanoate aminotransferase